MACCTTLSSGQLIPKGLIFPFALGIYTLLAGLGRYFSILSCSDILSNHSSDIPSRVVLSDPLVIFPGFDLIVSYAYRRIRGSDSVINAFRHRLFSSNLSLSRNIFVRFLSLYFIFICFIVTSINRSNNRNCYRVFSFHAGRRMNLVPNPGPRGLFTAWNPVICSLSRCCGASFSGTPSILPHSLLIKLGASRPDHYILR